MSELLRSERVPMSGVDSAWLSMESPTNLMMITVGFVIEGRLGYAALKDTFSRRFLIYGRFTQRPLQLGRRSYWETDPNFDIEAHLVRTALPGEADKAELQALISRLASTPLDAKQALWQVHLVENYGDASVLIARIHHCYADGTALMQVLLSMTDETPVPGPVGRKRRGGRRLRSDHGGVFERLYRPAVRRLEQALGYAVRLRAEGSKVLRNPASVGAAYLSDAYDIAAGLASAASLPDDARTRFKGSLGTCKKVAWCESISLAEVKAVAGALGSTVNDVLLAVVTGALRTYLQDKGDSVDGISIRTVVPVSLRLREEAEALGNHFGLVFPSLPIGTDNPLERLYCIQQEMLKLKAAKQAVMAFGALAAMGLAPRRLRRQALKLLARKTTAVVTNIAGPRMELYFAGRRLRELMFWVPQAGALGMGVSILSYNGKVRFGLITDPKLVDDPDSIVCKFAGELEKLLMITLMEPWDEARTPAEVEATLTVYAERAREIGNLEE